MAPASLHACTPSAHARLCIPHERCAAPHLQAAALVDLLALGALGALGGRAAATATATAAATALGTRLARLTGLARRAGRGGDAVLLVVLQRMAGVRSSWADVVAGRGRKASPRRCARSTPQIPRPARMHARIQLLLCLPHSIRSHATTAPPHHHTHSQPAVRAAPTCLTSRSSRSSRTRMVRPPSSTPLRVLMAVSASSGVSNSTMPQPLERPAGGRAGAATGVSRGAAQRAARGGPPASPAGCCCVHRCCRRRLFSPMAPAAPCCGSWACARAGRGPPTGKVPTAGPCSASAALQAVRRPCQQGSHAPASSLITLEYTTLPHSRNLRQRSSSRGSIIGQRDAGLTAACPAERNHRHRAPRRAQLHALVLQVLPRSAPGQVGDVNTAANVHDLLCVCNGRQVCGRRRGVTESLVNASCATQGAQSAGQP